MTYFRPFPVVTLALGLLLASSSAFAQPEEHCNVFCVPEFLVEPTWTIENLAHRPRVIDPAGSQARHLPRERVFELVLAVDVPTRWKRIGVTAESIFAPASNDNEIELELELNIGLIQPEQTGGWLSSHVDLVDQFGPAERPSNRAYVHRLDFELDTAVHLFKKAPWTFLRSVEVEGSLDYLATGLPRRGDVINGTEYLDPASRWSFSFVLVIPVAPR